MADDFLSSLQNHKQSFSLPDIDPNTDFLHRCAGITPRHQEFSALNFHGLVGYQHDKPFPPLTNCTGKSARHTELFVQDASSVVVPPAMDHTLYTESDHRDRKKKASSSSTTKASSSNSSPHVSVHEKMEKNSSRRGKKAKRSEKEEDEEKEQAREVVHVRAKRGQATDSHSLAERVRRGKINERLRYLQDIVPGCYKTMGMAVMLDEIINYVQSLHNQVEFLSMKLTTASAVYDFNSDTNTMERVEGLPLYILQKEQAHEAFKNLALPSPHFAPPEFYKELPHKNS